MDKLKLNSTIVRAPGLLCSLIGQDVVILHLLQDSYFSLNEVASDIWSRVEQPRVVNDLCNELAAEYDVAHETINREVLTLLTDLADAGLIMVS